MDRLITVDKKALNLPPRIVWQEGYKLFKFAEPPNIYLDLATDAHVFTFDKLYQQPNLTLFSELGSGRKIFLKSYQDYLKSKKQPWLSVHKIEWDQESFLYSPDFNDPKFATAIEDLGTKSGVGEKIKPLKDWLKNSSTTRLTLIIQSLSGFAKRNAEDKQHAEEILMVLRQLYDDKSSLATDKLQTIMVDSSDTFYQEQPEFSSYLPLCEQYRLPYLNAGEIECLALNGYSLELDIDAIERLLDHTGGHPLLLGDCLKRLEESSISSPNQRQIDQVARKMRASPPQTTKLWKDELKNILTINEDLLHAMKAYVSGETLGDWRFPPPAQERPLFITGWLTLNRYGRWGITSTFHADLARVVLDGFR